jgi:FkbM family methyltransferase
MKQFQGVWFPDHEIHLQDWMQKAGEIVDGRGTYQIKKLRTAVGLCKQRRVAVDVGGHVGLWSMQLVKLFGRVHAFEPVAAHQECFVKNVIEHGVGDPILHEYALGEQEGQIAISTEQGSSGNSHINAKVPGSIPMKTLDSLALDEVDFMKLDTEGYEENILRGAIETIKRCRPVIIVEQKRDMAEARFGLRPRGAVTFLESLGYKLAKEMSGDYIMVPT